jgi:hypothetical protein
VRLVDDEQRVGVGHRAPQQLPRRQHESPAGFGGHPHGVLGRQKELRPRGGAVGDRPRDRLDAVAAEHARVCEVEVEVGVAVHVGEARPAAAVDDDRRMLVELSIQVIGTPARRTVAKQRAVPTGQPGAATRDLTGHLPGRERARPGPRIAP